MARPDVYKKRTYLGISDGFITENVPEGTADAVRKVRKNGNVYHELQYPFWTGIVTSIKLFEKNYEGQIFKTWNIVLEDPDDGEEFTLSVAMQSANANSLYCKLEGADLSKSIKIQPYNFVSDDNGKKVVGLNIYQYDQKIDPTYTRDNMPVKPREKTGADAGKWDFSAVNEFLSGKFLELADKVKAMNPSTEGAVKYSAPSKTEAQPVTAAAATSQPLTPITPNVNADAEIQQEVDDDLPF